jgi:ssDNA-binding Zn-finger/Zn-ribbon topoisomerase 1
MGGSLAMKILDIIDQSIPKEICPKCGKPKNGILRKRSNDFGAVGFRGNSHYECKDGYQTKEEAGLCTC